MVSFSALACGNGYFKTPLTRTILFDWPYALQRHTYRAAITKLEVVCVQNLKPF